MAFTLDPKSTALLLTDFQNDIVAADGVLAPDDPKIGAEVANAVSQATAIADAARGAGILDIFIVLERGRGEPPFNGDMPLLKTVAEMDVPVRDSIGSKIFKDV